MVILMLFLLSLFQLLRLLTIQQQHLFLGCQALYFHVVRYFLLFVDDESDESDESGVVVHRHFHCFLLRRSEQLLVKQHLLALVVLLLLVLRLSISRYDDDCHYGHAYVLLLQEFLFPFVVGEVLLQPLLAFQL